MKVSDASQKRCGRRFCEASLNSVSCACSSSIGTFYLFFIAHDRQDAAPARLFALDVAEQIVQHFDRLAVHGNDEVRFGAIDAAKDQAAGLKGPEVKVIRRGGMVFRSVDRSKADLIVAVDGKPIKVLDDLLSHVESKKPGEHIVLTIVRDEKKIEGADRAGASAEPLSLATLRRSVFASTLLRSVTNLHSLSCRLPFFPPPQSGFASWAFHFCQSVSSSFRLSGCLSDRSFARRCPWRGCTA